MKVSIIIPVYNVSQYIVRCISSVINQIYTNIECIIVDDHSKDDSMKLCKNIISNYRGPISFIFLTHKSNRGLSAARNTGTQQATGDYIYYLDSDDEIYPTTILDLIKISKQYPDAEIIQGKTFSNQNQEYYNYQPSQLYLTNNKEIQNVFYTTNFPINAWNKLIKKDFIVKNNLNFKEGIIHEDELWCFFTIKKLTSIAFSQEYTYKHYIREGSIMTINNQNRSSINWAIILTEIFNYKEKTIFIEQTIKKYIPLYIKWHNIYSKQKQWNLVYQNIKERIKDSGNLYLLFFIIFYTRLFRVHHGKGFFHILSFLIK
ncbi:MAG: hypothetical protein BHV84_03665 [Prevotella sp. AG:487_50_53]|nr:MAG: hypothetical protein BHV84_03665 [Prevotella sp. AG:487_50_53]